MNRIRTKWRGCRAIVTVFFLGIATTTVCGRAEEIYPRANAVETMQSLAGSLDQTYAAFFPALNAVLPASTRFRLERSLANVDTALSAYALADLHGARAQELALAASDEEAAGEEIVDRADMALTVGDYARCERLAQTLAQLARDTGSERLRMHAEVFLGVLDRRHGNLDGASSHQHQALELARALGDESASSRALAHLGTVNRDRGDFAQALDLQLQSLAIGEKIDDRTELTYRNLALLYRELGDEAASKQYFDKAIAAAERNGDPSHYATVYGSYSSFLNDTHDYAAALDAARETLALDQVLNDRPAAAFEELESGRALLGLKRFDEAGVSLDAALAAGRAINQREIVARSLLALAEISLTRGDRARARDLLDQAQNGLDATRMKPQLAQAYALREQLAAADGNASSALDYAHKYAALREDLLGTTTSRQLAALEARHARADAEQKLALANEANALQAARLEQQRLQRAFGIAVIAALALLLAVVIWRWLDMGRLNRALNARNAQIEQQRSALTDANQRLERQTSELYQAAITDPLTGAFNRGHLLRDLDRRIADCARDGRELALLMIDFDHFKRINDTRGHIFGDRVLVAGVHTIRQWLEPDALFGRFGGEEFLIAIQDQGIDAVREFANRLRVRVAEDLSNLASESRNYATISIGIATLAQIPPPARLEDLLEAADQAVYAAKRAGRDRVVYYAA
ncbi:MAG: diguanylate cyclase [Rudaea sp.]|nr:diguanylate cyclase [Rudaea sp.]